MTQVDHLKTEIESLSADEFADLRNWIVEKDWQLWDKQIGEDSASGTLDFLIDEALSAKSAKQLKDL